VGKQVGSWQILNERLLVDRSPYARVSEQDLLLPNGQIINNFVQVDLPPYVMVLALLDNGCVPFVRQYRQAVGDFLLELPAGHIENGEEALAAAQRELREEAGVVAAEWHFLGKYVMDANRCCGWGFFYLARGAQQIAAPDPGDLGEMTVQLRTLDEMRVLLSAGTLVSGPTALCIGLALNALQC
jgi:8-oxo-dGTP pyrophosphatase MutT (NUDIX family)